MSYTAIWEVSNFLRDVLWNGFFNDPSFVQTQYLKDKKSIKLTNPAAKDDDRRLSLWLYNILPNEHLRNTNFARVKDDERIQFPPLSVNLYYLLTPSTSTEGNDDEGNQYLLGKSMQILNDSSILQFQNPSAKGTGDELHVSLAQRSIAELAEVWEALQQSYRLSVCYEVRAVRIASQREIDASRVRERATEFQPAGAVG